MKKFYAIVVAMILVTASFAQKPNTHAPLGKSLQGHETTSERQIQLKNGKQFAPVKYSMHKAKHQAASYDLDNLELISEAPAGTEEQRLVSSTYYEVSWGYVYETENNGALKDFVVGDDGCYYLKNPFTGLTTNTYLKLEKDGDNEYVAKLPQAVYHEEGEMENEDGSMEAYNNMYYVFAMEYYEYEQDGETHATYKPADVQEYRFTVKGDSLVCNDSEVQLAMGDSIGQWMGYGDYNVCISPFSAKTLEVDESIASTAQKFALSYEDYTDSRYGYLIDAAFTDDGHIYVKGVFESLPDVWVEGTFDGSKATFKSGQYVGFNEDYQSLLYFCAADIGEVYDEDYDEYYDDYVYADEIVFDVDLATMTFSTDRHIVMNMYKDTRVSYIDALAYPSISFYTEKAGTPQNPEFLEFYDLDEDAGYGGSFVYMPIFDTTGALMDKDKLTYTYYASYDGEDEEVVITPEEYGVEEEMTELPYAFAAGLYYYDIYSDRADHYFYFYFTGFSKFGVKTTYYGGGEKHDSDIVWYDLENEDGVKAISPAADVKNISYTDIAGRKVSRPTNGIYVKTITYTDGTVVSKKVIR